jgi:hypothetical protein
MISDIPVQCPRVNATSPNCHNYLFFLAVLYRCFLPLAMALILPLRE